ncbi:zinc-ribbon domain-containing protein [Staphylococcus massiliensis]|uniref:TcaA second domain-containing protein n=1 Tax=Staphylococcus massiliensis TaxID=555791 RepID=UPI001EDD12D9|nr:zinc-ribbon domain-containing protein [Staphylococcus massiliensis]MCG3412412.1 zinc-ribbon domain-containing protein [Staphylococcus massiliensis]
MKFCRQCGAKLREGTKVCTNCGAKITASHEASQSKQQNDTTQTSNQPSRNQTPKKPMSKKTKIIIGAIAALLILLLIAYLIAKSQLSPEKQADQIASDIRNNDAKSLSQHVTKNSEDLSETEATAYLEYIDHASNRDTVADHIKNKSQSLDKSFTSNSVSADNETIMNIDKNGKKFLLFPNYEFDIPTKTNYIRPETDGELEYKFNGKKKQVTLVEEDEKELGEFALGNYHIKAKKKIGDKTLDGAIDIDMTDETDLATESFKQKRFTVSVDGGYSLEDIKVYVNKKAYDENDTYDKTFGPFTPDEKVSVYAEGKIEDKTFKSNTVEVKSPTDDDELEDIKLKFDDKAIDAYEDKKLDEELQETMDDSDNASDSEEDSSDSKEDTSKSEDGSSESTETVTRENVIDIVEDYEGSQLDTDTYTYKEPEKLDEGGWGFSFTDKDGNLAGSYKISDDGVVTKYDENGEETF